MKWTKCAVWFLRISRPGVRVPSIAPRKTSTHCVLVFLFVCTMEGARTRRRRTAPQAISPVQQRRPQPAAETGRSCWGRVLIFQSPAKGLRKNQQMQPVRPRRFPTGRNVYRDAGTVWGFFFVVDGTGREQCGSAVSGLQISLYRRCSFLDGCGILGLVQQIGIYKGEY